MEGWKSRSIPPLFKGYMAKKIAIKIYYNEHSGEIEKIDCTNRFAEEGPLFRMDVLKDSIEALESIYNYEKELFFDDNPRLARA